MNQTDETILNGVLAQFAELCRRPHPSRGEGPLADYVENLLRARGLSPVRDEWNNIMADVPAAPGRATAPLTVIQGHLDMVCAVKEGSGYDPMTSPVTCVVEDGVLRSDGNSSLGADNCLGNAAVLWLMGQDAPHGPVRLLFTVAEEVGLVGAKKVDPQWLAGAKYLINTDGFALGRAIVSSAGGLRETFSAPLALTSRKKQAAYRLELSGFPGGHSGYDIHRGRTNPIRLAAEFLRTLNVDWELLELHGGHAHNAIPMDCTALLAVDGCDAPALETAAEEFFKNTPDGRAVLAPIQSQQRSAWPNDFRDRVLAALGELTIGVYAWRDKERGQVSASANLGSVGQKDGAFQVACFIRAARVEDQDALAAQHGRVMAGFSCVADGYPGWPEREENPLVDAMCAVWQGLTGRNMEVAAVHVGLEPSVLGAKNPGLLMVNTGPDIFDPHSLDEHAPVAGLPLYVRLLADTLEALS